MAAPDLPDFCSPIFIAGITIASVPIDIVAQTIGNIAIDIAAQSLAQVNINIAASAITLSVDIVAQTVGNITIDIAAQSVGNVAVNIAASAITLNVDIVAQTVGNISVNIAASAITLSVDIVAQTVGNINVNIAASAITLSVDIVAQTVGNITIDIAAQSVGNINIDIAAQTVDLNIKTSGGANIVIDQLTQAAYLERRSLLLNNGAVASWNTALGTNRKGKFFPRGCRGFLERIQVHGRDAGAAGGTMTVYVSPNIGMGYVASATIVVPAGGGEVWRNATFNQFWNYDSMFIFVLSSTADMEFGYDTGEPYDAHESTDSGASWVPRSWRLWFKVIMRAQTIGDLPVSGTINNIEIPSDVAVRQSISLDVPADDVKFDTEQIGSGELIICMFVAPSDAARDDLYPRIECDNKAILPLSVSMANWNSLFITPTSLGVCIGAWNETAHYYTLIVVLPFPFRRSLKVGWYNVAAAVRTGSVAYTYKKIA